MDLINPDELNGVRLDYDGIVKVKDNCAKEYSIFQDERYALIIKRHISNPIELYCFKKRDEKPFTPEQTFDAYLKKYKE